MREDDAKLCESRTAGGPIKSIFKHVIQDKVPSIYDHSRSANPDAINHPKMRHLDIDPCLGPNIRRAFQEFAPIELELADVFHVIPN